MEKILITVYVLSIEKNYDILIPINLNAKEVLDIIQKTIYELSEELYIINENALLYDENGNLINLNNNVRFSGVKNGSKLLLK